MIKIPDKLIQRHNWEVLSNIGPNKTKYFCPECECTLLLSKNPFNENVEFAFFHDGIRLDFTNKNTYNKSVRDCMEYLIEDILE